ncbi:MAG: AMP-binding protein [Synergistaceae bacterium]
MTPRIESKIFETLDKMPNEPVFCWQNTWWSRAAFHELIDECESRLTESQFKKGQKIALLLPNSPIMLAVTIAVWRLGGTIVPIDPKGGYVPILNQILHADVFATITYIGCSSLVPLISEEGIPCVITPLDSPGEIIAGRSTDLDSPDTAVIFYTSGTTGTPKAVPLTHDNIMSFFSSCAGHFTDVTDDDVFFNAIPDFNAYGLLGNAILPLLLGAKQLILQSFMPAKKALESMKNAEVTVLLTVPSMLSLIFRALKNGAVSPRSLRYILVGADRLPEKFHKKATDFFGLEIMEGYGLTETSSVVALPPLGKKKPGTLGTFISCVKAEIRDADGNVLPHGGEGNLWLSGDSVATSYYRNPTLTEERFKDGWFNTSDIAKIDEDGYLTLVGRTTDMIFVGGFKVYSSEVEKVIAEHPDVAEVAVVGIPRPLSGEIVKACIVVKDGHTVTSKEIIEFCKRKMAYYKVPRIIEFIDIMPRSPIGDILKRNLIHEE